MWFRSSKHWGNSEPSWNLLFFLATRSSWISEELLALFEKRLSPIPIEHHHVPNQNRHNWRFPKIGLPRTHIIHIYRWDFPWKKNNHFGLLPWLWRNPPIFWGYTPFSEQPFGVPRHRFKLTPAESSPFPDKKTAGDPGLFAWFPYWLVLFGIQVLVLPESRKMR